MLVEIPPGLALLALAGLLLLFMFYSRLIKRYDIKAPKKAKKLRRYRFRFVLSSLIGFLVFMVAAPVILLPVHPGEVGVLWQRFAGGTLVNKPIPEGTVLVLPWNRLFTYSTRFQTSRISVEAVTRGGLKINLDTVVRFRPVREQIPGLHKYVGEDYIQRLIVPEVGSAARLIVADYNAEQVYSDERAKVQERIFNLVNASLRLNEKSLLKQHDQPGLSRFIHLEDILIRDVELPKKVNLAIINKVNQKYLDDEYLMRIEVAKKEAARKKIEAQGIAAFQREVAGGISETYLRWRGIEATIDLAKSNNSKVVVIGSGKDGLPLILNTESSLKPASVPDNALRPIQNSASIQDKPSDQHLALTDTNPQAGPGNPERIEASSSAYPN